MQSVVVLNMNMEVFRIHDMHTLLQNRGIIQEKKLTMFYIEAHNPFVIKMENLNQNLNISLDK